MNPALGCSVFVNCSYSRGTMEHILFLQHCVLAGGSHYCQRLAMLTAPRPCPPSTTAPAGGSHQLQGRRQEPEGVVFRNKQKLGHLLLNTDAVSLTPCPTCLLSRKLQTNLSSAGNTLPCSQCNEVQVRKASF